MYSLPAFLVVDYGTDFRSEFFLHALHDRVGHGTTARTGAVRGTRTWRRCLGSELRSSTHHLELQRLARRTEKRVLHDAFWSVAKSNVNHDLRHGYFHRDFNTAHGPLAGLKVVRQHLLAGIFESARSEEHTS